MQVTIFIAKRFRISKGTEISDYIRDTIDIDGNVTPEKIAEIIHRRIDSLSLSLNKTISYQLHSIAS